MAIFDGGKQVLYIVDPARKTYMEMTKADVDQLSAQLQGAMAQMKAQLEKLPPAQRAQMEAMMKGVQRTRTGSDTVGRWTCDKYDLTQGGRKIGEVCTVNATTLGFGTTDATRIVTAASELARNAFRYAGGGVMRCCRLDADGKAGIELTFVDHGPGISDIAQAMQEGYTTGGGLGLGLPAAKRLMGEMEIRSEIGKGTSVTVRKWRTG